MLDCSPNPNFIKFPISICILMHYNLKINNKKNYLSQNDKKYKISGPHSKDQDFMSQQIKLYFINVVGIVPSYCFF